MNEFQKTLYDDLLKLVETNEAFFYRDYRYGESYFRIFDYRLASYTDFLQPGAVECRGVMYELHPETKQPLCLAALPMAKFWNLYENPNTMDLDLSTVDFIEEKADGSLISTYLYWDGDYAELRLKSKGSIESTQCLDAMDYLHNADNWQFHWDLKMLTMRGHTVNLEWCSPDNRIVLGYDKPSLRVLNIRNRNTGEFVEKHDPLVVSYGEIQRRWVGRLFDEEGIDAEIITDFIDHIPDMKEIEGFVLHLRSGQRVKVKTSWYLARHHVKDSINSPRRLFEAVLEEATDDMRTMFHTDALALATIADMEQKVAHIYNHTVDTVERFYERNKHLERKEYAILGQQELERKIFSLAMQKYLDKPVDYKLWMKKHYRDFGIKDEVENG